MSLNLFLSEHGVWLLLSVIFGASVGAAELVARYRDEPQIVVTSWPGLFYMSLNGLISAAAYGLVVYYNDRIFVGLKSDRLMTSIVAGFGSMLVMRSKLFSFKTEGGDTFAVGPDVVLSTFLRSMDRRIDRNRSSPRQKLVYESVKKLNDPSRAPDFIRISLASYQNLSDAEKAELDGIIREVKSKTDLPPQLQVMAICFGLLNVTGEKNFEALMAQLKEFLDSPEA